MTNKSENLDAIGNLKPPSLSPELTSFSLFYKTN